MKIGILGSGSGTNAEAIIKSVKVGECPVEIAIIISDVENAFILERGRKHNIPVRYINPGKHKTWLEPEIEMDYVRTLKDSGVELVVLAGYMRIVKETMLDAFPRRIINIHPALLPSFPGLQSWRQALDYGVRFTGCTVHFVEKGVDSGPIILQAIVPVFDDDTMETLHARIQVEEHRIYPEAIRLIAEGRIEISGRKVRIRNIANLKTKS
jgi:phosphoribosylglycinamide formyltransferase 1